MRGPQASAVGQVIVVDDGSEMFVNWLHRLVPGWGFFVWWYFSSWARCSIVAGKGLTCRRASFSVLGSRPSWQWGAPRGARSTFGNGSDRVLSRPTAESIAISSTFRAAWPNNQIGPPASPTLRVSNRNDAECRWHVVTITHGWCRGRPIDPTLRRCRKRGRRAFHSMQIDFARWFLSLSSVSTFSSTWPKGSPGR